MVESDGMITQSIKTIEATVVKASVNVKISRKEKPKIIGEAVIEYDCPTCKGYSAHKVQLNSKYDSLEIHCRNCEQALYVSPLADLRISVSKIEQITK